MDCQGVRHTRTLRRAQQHSITTGHLRCLLSMEAQHTTNRDELTRFRQACLLGYIPSPQQAFQGDAAHQAQRRPWLTPNGSPGTWYTRRDYRSWTIRPCHRTVFTAHTWSALPAALAIGYAATLADPTRRSPSARSYSKYWACGSTPSQNPTGRGKTQPTAGSDRPHHSWPSYPCPR